MLLLGLSLLLVGCNDFNVRNLAKSDVDMIVDLHLAELNQLNRQLLIKLYKRNPRELKKHPGNTIESRLRQVKLPPPGQQPNYRFAELDNRVGEAALRLAFDADFRGDRVFALVVGIKSMLHASYSMKTELFLLDELNQQLLYNSARNLEIANWRLNNFRNNKGQLLLLSNGYQDGIANLSFERLFGKMILIQDMMAKVVADRNNRTINTVVHSVASTTFLPIPF